MAEQTSSPNRPLLALMLFEVLKRTSVALLVTFLTSQSAFPFPCYLLRTSVVPETLASHLLP